MQAGDEQAQSAQWLMASAFQGVLSTQSVEHPGYPFGSVVPYMLDQRGTPVFLLSHLSQHTRNLDTDGHCGLTLVEAGTGDIQKLCRLSAIGDVVQTDANPDLERYFDYFPQSRLYHERLRFCFYRFEPVRFHWNGGFAAARWFAAGRLLRPRPFGADTEKGVLAEMNRENADTLRTCLRRATGENIQAPVVMVGIDSTGIDLRVGENLFRVALPRQIATTRAAHAALADLMADQPTAAE